MICGSAATVWERSPPPSCKSTMLPAPTVGAVAALTIFFEPGRLQSLVSVVHNTSRRPSWAKMRCTVGSVAPNGGRRQPLRGPRATSERISAAVSVVRSGWLYV